MVRDRRTGIRNSLLGWDIDLGMFGTLMGEEFVGIREITEAKRLYKELIAA